MNTDFSILKLVVLQASVSDGSLEASNETRTDLRNDFYSNLNSNSGGSLFVLQLLVYAKACVHKRKNSVSVVQFTIKTAPSYIRN